MQPKEPERPLREGHCHTLRGMAVVRHRFQIDVRALPGLTIDGLREAERRDVQARVRAAAASVARFPRDMPGIDIRIDPTHARGRTELLELQLALALCGSDAPVVAGVRLDGRLLPIAGALLHAEALQQAGATHLMSTVENAGEVALTGLPVFLVERLSDCTKALAELPRFVPSDEPSAPSSLPDLVDVPHPEARRVLEIAAAGGHGLLLTGPAGVGKSMLARRLTTILPAPTEDESISITRCASAAGLNIGATAGRIDRRPFRAPHSSTSTAGLVGGGAPHPRPGELTLASHGVLFLDEVSEFLRAALEALREPVATGEIVLHRADGTLVFPSRVQLVAAMDACPCGRRAPPGREAPLPCRCTESDLRRFEARVAPIDALFDLRAALPPIDLRELEAPARTRESSATVRARVTASRALQLRRQMKENARLGVVDIDAHAPLSPALWKSFALPLDRSGVIAVRRVARTIADLAGADAIQAVHLEEALQWSRATGR